MELLELDFKQHELFVALESGLTGDIFKYLWHLLPFPMERVVTSIKWLSYIGVMENNHIGEVRDREKREKPAKPSFNLKKSLCNKLLLLQGWIHVKALMLVQVFTNKQNIINCVHSCAWAAFAFYRLPRLSKEPEG